MQTKKIIIIGTTASNLFIFRKDFIIDCIENNIQVFVFVSEYTDEWIEKLSELSEKNIAGVITTNYDSFLEKHFQGYVTYVGQKQLIFSAMYSIAASGTALPVGLFGVHKTARDASLSFTA